MLLRIGLISMVGSTLGQKTRNGSIRLARAANALPWPSTARAVTAKFLKSRRVYPTRSPLAARWLTGGARSELQAQACGQGVVARVFGVMAHTAPGPSRLALRFNTVLQPMSVQRRYKARFRVVVHEPIHLEHTGNLTADIEAGVHKVNAFIEERVRERPAEWFWTHKRWPSDTYKRSR